MKWGTHTRIFSPNIRAWEQQECNKTDEDGKRDVSMEKSKAGTKERCLDGLSLPNQNTILINIKWYYFTRYGKSTMEFN